MCFSSKSKSTAKEGAAPKPVDPASQPAANVTKPNPAVLSTTSPTNDPLGQSQLGQ
jgi:hypothetical protein